MANYSSRYKGSSTRAATPVAFRTFSDVRPLLRRYVLPVYSDPVGAPQKIVCDSMAAALALKERMTESDRLEFERQS